MESIGLIMAIYDYINVSTLNHNKKVKSTMQNSNLNNKKKYARPNYYQGILQLRDVNDEILAFVYNKISKRPDAAVTKTVKHPNGIDLFITSQKFIRILGKKLKESFGGELKVSSKLHTTNRQGRELYRVNVLFRLAKYKKGDIISTRSGDQVRLLNLGKKIFAKSLKTGKKMVVRIHDLPRY